MMLALLVVAGVTFSLLFGLVHKVSERRTKRRLQQQWEERERALNRRASPLAPRLTRYSITWSARPSSEGGMVRPSVLAALRLTTISYLPGCSTGRSP